MNECLSITLSLLLGIVGISVSFAALVFSIIFLVKIFKLEKEQKRLEVQQQNLNKISDFLVDISIGQCVLYSDTGIIKGRDAINEIKEKYKLRTDMEAILKYYEGVFNE